MQHDSHASEALAWLEKARADLISAKVLLKTKDPSQLYQVLFHCQQAAEKSLKAFLVWHAVSFRWTHDIAEIGDQCALIEKSFEPLIGQVKYLSDYAWVYRYPGEDPLPTVKEAKAGLRDAKRVFSVAKKSLPKEMHAKRFPTRQPRSLRKRTKR
ncbi:MAG: HEPN domain-containing protein [Deltaproteobacteria bacterium]|nr:HEPN domain-containing protein [Deltaproteobacteria bacterium]